MTASMEELLPQGGGGGIGLQLPYWEHPKVPMVTLTFVGYVEDFSNFLSGCFEVNSTGSEGDLHQCGNRTVKPGWGPNPYLLFPEQSLAGNMYLKIPEDYRFHPSERVPVDLPSFCLCFYIFFSRFSF